MDTRLARNSDIAWAQIWAEVSDIGPTANLDWANVPRYVSCILEWGSVPVIYMELVSSTLRPVSVWCPEFSFTGTSWNRWPDLPDKPLPHFLHLFYRPSHSLPIGILTFSSQKQKVNITVLCVFVLKRYSTNDSSNFNAANNKVNIMHNNYHIWM